jgi:hypothetical protein
MWAAEGFARLKELHQALAVACESEWGGGEDLKCVGMVVIVGDCKSGVQSGEPTFFL